MVDQPDPEGLDRSLAAAVDTAAGALLSVWDAARESAVSQLSSSQLRAVMVIERCDGINLRGLAKDLGMILSSASRLCDRLVASGLVEREPGRVDRREIALHLTPAGRALLTDLRGERQERLARVLGTMSPAGRQALLRGLQEFDAVLNAIGKAEGDTAARTA
jgi:DNA-binding MarR family transcriptional regulator